jgi:ABC-2 type transport system permease protein
MRNVLAIARKEIRSYFASPTAYVVTAVILVISAAFQWAQLLGGQAGANLFNLFGPLQIILIFLAPAITMRLFAEEQSSGTIELLLTSPVREWEVVIGKYLAALTLFLLIVVLTMWNLVLLFIYGSPDIGPIISGYLGLILTGAAFLAVGMLTSTFTKNQIVSWVVSIGVLLLLLLIPNIARLAPPPADIIIRYLSFSEHSGALTRGLIEVRDLVYYISFIAVFLFLTMRSLETRRWR